MDKLEKIFYYRENENLQYLDKERGKEDCHKSHLCIQRTIPKVTNTVLSTGMLSSQITLVINYPNISKTLHKGKKIQCSSEVWQNVRSGNKLGYPSGGYRLRSYHFSPIDFGVTWRDQEKKKKALDFFFFWVENENFIFFHLLFTKQVEFMPRLTFEKIWRQRQKSVLLSC